MSRVALHIAAICFWLSVIAAAFEGIVAFGEPSTNILRNFGSAIMLALMWGLIWWRLMWERSERPSRPPEPKA
jgi:hypothetical protein